MAKPNQPTQATKPTSETKPQDVPETVATPEVAPVTEQPATVTGQPATATLDPLGDPLDATRAKLPYLSGAVADPSLVNELELADPLQAVMVPVASLSVGTGVNFRDVTDIVNQQNKDELKAIIRRDGFIRKPLDVFIEDDLVSEGKLGKRVVIQDGGTRAQVATELQAEEAAKPDSDPTKDLTRWLTIPVFVKAKLNSGQAALAFIANSAGKAPTLFEQLDVARTLRGKPFNYTWQEVAAVLGVSKANLLNHVRDLDHATETMRNYVREGKLSATTLCDRITKVLKGKDTPLRVQTAINNLEGSLAARFANVQAAGGNVQASASDEDVADLAAGKPTKHTRWVASYGTPEKATQASIVDAAREALRLLAGATVDPTAVRTVILAAFKTAGIPEVNPAIAEAEAEAQATLAAAKQALAEAEEKAKQAEAAATSAANAKAAAATASA